MEAVRALNQADVGPAADGPTGVDTFRGVSASEPAAAGEKSKTGKPRRGWIAIVAVGLVFVGVPLVRFLLTPESEVVTERTLVYVEPVRVGPIEETLRYPGSLQAESTIVVTPKLAGRLETISVDENDTVAVGDIIAIVEADVARLQVAQAEAAVRAAEAQVRKAEQGVRPAEIENANASLAQAEEDLQLARSNLDRQERLYNAGTVTRASYEDAQNRYRSAETTLENARRSVAMMEEGASDEDKELAAANLEASQRQLELAQLQLSNATVRAPIAGTVARVMVEEGNMVGTSTALVAIINDSLIRAVTAVPERHYGRFLEAGTDVTARVEAVAYPDHEPFVGVVGTISSVVDPESRTFTVEVAIDNRRSLLRPGMFVNIEFVIDRREDRILIPNGAMLLRNGTDVVFVVDESVDGTVARMVDVEPGLTQGEWTEIIAGLTPDAEVVTNGNSFIEEGQLVRVSREEG